MLETLNQQAWEEDHKKIVVMIGDQIPHTPEETLSLMTLYNLPNPRKINWEKEVLDLQAKGVRIHGV